MAYANQNFQTKKALKEAVASGTGDLGAHQLTPTGRTELTNGTAYLEGPHYPQPHRWYAQVLLKDGKIVKVKA